MSPGAPVEMNRPRPRLFAVITAHVLLHLTYPLAAGMLVNSIVGSDFRGFAIWTALLVCLPLVEAAFYSFREWGVNMWAEDVGLGLRARLLRHVLSLPQTYFFGSKSGEVATRLTEDVRQFADGRRLIADAIAHVLTVVVALGFLAAGNLVLMATVLGAGLAYAGNAALLLPMLRRQSKENLASLERMNEYLRERLHILPFTRFTGSSRWESDEFRRLSETVIVPAQSREALVTFLMGAAAGVLQALSVACLYGVGGYLLFTRAITLGGLLIAVGYATRVSFAFQQLVEIAMKHQAVSVAGERATEILSAEAERWPGTAAPPEVVRSVEWRNVSFRYPGREEWALRDFSLRVEVGELTALVGPSGSGKSTALDLMAGLIRPDEGSVVINDAVDLRELDIRAWRRRVAYGTQFQFFFLDSLRRNLTYPSADGDEPRMAELAERLGIHQEIIGRPGGYDSPKGVRQSFSGGQRQRLGLVRALLSPEPALLILDEPTASLDVIAQGRAMELIASTKHLCPVLITTHRPSTMAYADRVVPMSEGRLVAPEGQRRPAADHGRPPESSELSRA